MGNTYTNPNDKKTYGFDENGETYEIASSTPTPTTTTKPPTGSGSTIPKYTGKYYDAYGYAYDTMDQAGQAGKYDFSGGYFYSPDKGLYSGAPVTNEGRAWIANFAVMNGRKPTSQEYNYWEGQQRQDVTSKWTYAEDSSPYNLGWRTPGDKRNLTGKTGRLHTYGPNVGNDKPYGGVVATDANGNPLYTTYDFDSRIGAGLFIKPPESTMPYSSQYINPDNLQNSRFGINEAQQNELYPQVQMGLPKYTPKLPPDMQTALQMPENAKIQQKLTEAQTNDRFVLDDINSLISSFSRDAVTGQVSDFDKPILSKSLYEYYDKLSDIVKSQYSFDDLEYSVLTQSNMEITPDAFSGLYDSAVKEWYNSEFGKAWQEKQKADKEQWDKEMFYPALDRVERGLVGVPIYDNDPDFNRFIQRNNFSPYVKNYLTTNYDNFQSMWQEQGNGEPFTQWLKQHILRSG